MIAVALVLLYLAIVKDYEPLLLLPIGAGCMLANLPLSPLIADDGMLRVLYNMGITNELFPLLIFIGIGALTDFGPLLENPRMVLLGAAGQFGIFLTLLLALVLGFSRPEAASIGIIGAIDGPTSIYVSGMLAPHLLGPITVAAYSYMSLVPIILPPDHAPAHDPRGAAHPHAVQPAHDQPPHAHPVSDRRHRARRDAGAVRHAADRHADARQPDEGIGGGGAADQGLGAGNRECGDAFSRTRDRLRRWSAPSS